MKRLGDPDVVVLRALQALMLGLPLLAGGRTPLAIAVAWPTVMGLLAIAVRERRRRGGQVAPGVGALTAFVLLALATMVPLPPALLAVLSPATARLTADMLPGWPASGGWSSWRPLAIDPWGVSGELARLAISLGLFAVVVAYPWRRRDAADDPHAGVFGRLLLTLLAGGLLVAILGLVQQAAGMLPIAGTEARGGRASGPFVNPNHFAGWLEMTIPLALTYLLALGRRLGRRLVRAADASRGIGVRAGRAWVSALVVHQRRLWAPLVTATALAVMAAAHLASGSRAGAVALMIGLAVTAAGIATAPASARGRRTRWRAAAAALALLLAASGAMMLWTRAESAAEAVAAVDTVDVSLASRVAVAARGAELVRDHLLFGTGLGSWLHAFRPYQAPPVDGGIWDHAHDEYLELAAEAGLAGVGLAIVFAVAVARAIRRRGSETAIARRDRPPGFELAEWREALDEHALLRAGLAGGVVAILVHSTLDFGLRMPANLTAFMVILGLLVLSGTPRPTAAARAPGVLLAALLLAAVLPLADTIAAAAGRPLSPERCLAAADVALSEGSDTGRAPAVALVRSALDRSPADRAAHELLARALGPGPEGDAALERAIALNPWSTELRDRLAFRLWARDERAAGAAELEESMFRSPCLVAHGFLATDGALANDAGALVRVLVEGDTLPVRLAALDPAIADAIERGLVRSLARVPAGGARAAVVDDLVTLLEARGRFADAAATLDAEADPGTDGAGRLAHAAENWVKAGDRGAAERALLTALLRTPERGELYRALAVDVYGARHDFETAERVLRAGERSAVDILPVYDGVTQVLAQRESARLDALLPPAPAIGAEP